jgi:hypothetical protein
MKQVPEQIRFQFPSFPFLRDGKRGNCFQPIGSKSLRVSRRGSELYDC